MAFELFTRVALREDFPKHQLHRGDMATIVEYHPVANGEDGYSLEVFIPTYSASQISKPQGSTKQ